MLMMWYLLVKVVRILQTMLDAVSGYGRFKVEFSSDKSQVLIVNETAENEG